MLLPGKGTGTVRNDLLAVTLQNTSSLFCERPRTAAQKELGSSDCLELTKLCGGIL